MAIPFGISTFTLTIKAQNRKSKDSMLLEKNLFMRLLVQWRISFMHSISKNPQKGAEETVNFISFRCQLKWGARFAFSFAQLSLQVQPQERLGYYSNSPISNDVPNYPSMCQWNTRHALCSHTGKHQEKDVCMNKYSTSRFSLLVSYKFSCNKLRHLTVKMQSVFSQSGGKLMLWHHIPYRFLQGVQGLCLKSHRAMWVMWTPCSRTIASWNTDCSVKVFRVFFVKHSTYICGIRVSKHFSTDMKIPYDHDFKAHTVRIKYYKCSYYHSA